jgi:outer membrane protein
VRLLLALLIATPAQALDLLAVHERARQQAPSLLAAQAARLGQQARLDGARAQLGPQLQATVQPSEAASPASVQLTQTVFDAARWRTRAAEQQRLVSQDFEQRLSEQQLRQTSSRLYVQWHAQAELLKVQQGLARAYADEAARMAVRHREGLAAAVDWRQSQSFQWLAEANARSAAQQLQAQQQQLVAHMGMPLQEWLQPLRAAALPPLAAEQPADSPRLAALRAEAAAREQELGAAREAGWPTLSLQAQSQRELRHSPRASTHEWALLLRLPLWDHGSRAAGRDAARARLDAQTAAVQQLERDLQRELATQQEALQSAREQHATAQQALGAAAHTVKAMRIGQEQGSRSTSDVLLALQTEAQLRAVTVSAQASAWLAWIDWLAAQGRFDDAALAQLNAELETR